MKPRRFASSDVELMALVQLAAVPVMIHFQDDTQLEVAVDSWTSVRDLERQVSQTRSNFWTDFVWLNWCSHRGRKAVRRGMLKTLETPPCDL